MMGRLTSPQYLALLMGGAAVIGTVMILAVFLLQKSLGRSVKPDKPKTSPLKVEDESAFTLATVKSVVTQLKTEQQTLQEDLRAAERRADLGARHLEIIAGQFHQGLIIFDLHGYIAFSNPQVRTMLAIDTWSRRRYTDIFKDFLPLPELITGCFETGTEIRAKMLEFQGQDGIKRWVEASLFPSRNSTGQIESVVCIFRDVPPPAPAAAPAS